MPNDPIPSGVCLRMGIPEGSTWGHNAAEIRQIQQVLSSAISVTPRLLDILSTELPPNASFVLRNVFRVIELVTDNLVITQTCTCSSLYNFALYSQCTFILTPHCPSDNILFFTLSWHLTVKLTTLSTCHNL